MVATSEISKRITRTCYECGKTFDYEPLMALGRELFVRIRCDACDIIATGRQVRGDAEGWEQKRERERRGALEAEWKVICPPLYRSTDPKALQLQQDVLREVLGWTPQAKGIGLTGPSGTGKTRVMYLLLHRLHFEVGRRVIAIPAKEFERLCHKMFEKNDDARSKLEEVRAVQVLFIDDVGKEKYTDRVESEFYNLIEHRSAHLLPILWTANASGTQLTRMLSEDRGAPIVRRLREFSTVFSC